MRLLGLTRVRPFSTFGVPRNGAIHTASVCQLAGHGQEADDGAREAERGDSDGRDAGERVRERRPVPPRLSASRRGARPDGGRRGRARRRGGAGAGARPDDAEARARRLPGRRHLEVRPAFLHVVQRHPRVVQRLRQPDRPPPRSEALSEPRHRVEGDRLHDLDLQAPLGREVAQRRSLHLRRREVQPGADLRPGGQDDGGDGLHHHRPDRGAGPDHAGDPHQEVGPAAPGPACLLRRADRPEEVRGERRPRHLQRQAGGDRADQAHLVGEGRQGRLRGQRGLLGREDRRRPDDMAANPGDGAPGGRAPQGRGGRDHAASLGPLGPRQPERHDARRRRALRRALRPRDQRQEPAAEQRARPQGHGARRRPGVHRQGDVPRPGDRAQRADRAG